MSLFGALYAMLGILWLVSPVLPGSNVEDRVGKTIAILIGIFFVLYGFARILGVENHPVSDAIAVTMLVVVFVLAGVDTFIR